MRPAENPISHLHDSYRRHPPVDRAVGARFISIRFFVGRCPTLVLNGPLALGLRQY